MSIDSISSADSTAHVTNWVSKNSTVDQGAQPRTPAQPKVEDTIELSPAAKRFAVNGQLPPPTSFSGDEHAFIDGFLADMKKRMSEAKLLEQYSKQEEKFYMKMMHKHEAIMGQLIQQSGGLLYGSSFSYDLSKPITTTSGKPHPYAAELRSFLQDHKADLKQLESLETKRFMSFKDWKANRV